VVEERDLVRDGYPPTVYADPEHQFRYEVEQLWLWTAPEPERLPLIGYSVGPDWMASLDHTELVDRRKIVEVVIDVLTGRAPTSPARSVHAVRTHQAGSSPQRVREDQAVALRCSIKNNTASAARLMWWRLPDGSIELGRVAAHDDMNLR
jgi:hypothetical protein